MKNYKSLASPPHTDYTKFTGGQAGLPEPTDNTAIKRLENHLSGKSKYTSTKTDWVLVYCKEFEIKKDALIEEKRLKKLNRASIEKLISNN